MSNIVHSDQTLPGSGSPLSNSPAPPGMSRATNWIPAATSTAPVVLILGGLFAWGHWTDWTMPRFSSLVGTKHVEVEVWCQQHNVSEAQCIECNPKLIARLKDYAWCAEHGVFQCPWEHPDVAQVQVAPKTKMENLQRVQAALELRPRTENNQQCKNSLRRIQFASRQAIEKAGVDVAVVSERRVVEAITANAEAVYDQTRMAQLSSRVPGTVWRVEKKLGEAVHKGDVLALIDATEIGRAKTELLQAFSNLRLKQTQFERLQPLSERGSISSRSLLEAETAYRESQLRLRSAQQVLVNLGLPITTDDLAATNLEAVSQRLQFLGIPDKLMTGLDATKITSSLFPLRASLDGIVINLNLVEGEVVDPSRMLFSVADVSRLWLMLNVRQDEAK